MHALMRIFVVLVAPMTVIGHDFTRWKHQYDGVINRIPAWNDPWSWPQLLFFRQHRLSIGKELMSLWEELLRDGSDAERARYSPWFITDIGRLTRVLMVEDLQKLISIRPGLVFHGPLWSPWTWPVYALTIQSWFFSIRFPTREIKRLAGAGLSLYRDTEGILYGQSTWEMLNEVRSLVDHRALGTILHLYEQPLRTAMNSLRNHPTSSTRKEYRLRMCNYMAAVWFAGMNHIGDRDVSLRWNAIIEAFLSLNAVLNAMDPKRPCLTFSHEGQAAWPFQWDENADDLWEIISREPLGERVSFWSEPHIASGRTFQGTQ